MRVLVSGAPTAVAPVADALRERDAKVVEVTDLADMASVCQSAGPGAFDSYVQMPSTFQVSGYTAIQRVHNFYGQGVLARFAALDAAVPTLVPGGRVTFVMGQLPPEASTADDRAARRALVRVLAQAAAADAAEGRLQEYVLESGSPPSEIAFVALGGDLAKLELLGRLSTMSYAEWRVELLGLASVET